jgi:hypothetical protein
MHLFISIYPINVKVRKRTENKHVDLMLLWQWLSARMWHQVKKFSRFQRNVLPLFPGSKRKPSKRQAQLALHMPLAWFTPLPWRWRQYAPLNRWLNFYYICHWIIWKVLLTGDWLIVDVMIKGWSAGVLSDPLDIYAPCYVRSQRKENRTSSDTLNGQA